MLRCLEEGPRVEIWSGAGPLPRVEGEAATSVPNTGGAPQCSTSESVFGTESEGISNESGVFGSESETFGRKVEVFRSESEITGSDSVFKSGSEALESDSSGETNTETQDILCILEVLNNSSKANVETGLNGSEVKLENNPKQKDLGNISKKVDPLKALEGAQETVVGTTEKDSVPKISVDIPDISVTTSQTCVSSERSAAEIDNASKISVQKSEITPVDNAPKTPVGTSDSSQNTPKASSTSAPTLKPVTSVSGEGKEGEGMEVELPVPENLNSLFAVVKAVKTSHENLSTQEIENKFNQLSLAFRTDGVTLRQRLDLQQRYRDNAESNFDRELATLRESMVALLSECMDTDVADAVSLARRNLDILSTAHARLLSTSEVWGAVQQEWRVSRAVEVLMLHIDNVRRMYEREHQELDELRRLLKDYEIELPITTSQPAQDGPSRRVRALSLAVCGSNGNNKTQAESRRTSFTTSSASGRSPSFSGARTRRRASLQPDQLKPFRDQFAAVAAAAAAAQAAAKKEKSQEAAEVTNKGMLGITEEGSISEESDEDRLHHTSSSSPSSLSTTTTTLTTATVTTTTTTAKLTSTQSPHRAELERRCSVDSTASSSSQDLDPQPDLSSSTLMDTRHQHQQEGWMYRAVQSVMGRVGRGQWPYSPQETLAGARYVLTSVMVVMVFFLLLALCSGDLELPEPRHPGWVNFELLRHPYVTLRYQGFRPF